MANEISIIVPVHNEQANVLPLAEEVGAVFGKGPWNYELVFVDDASVDGTWKAIQEAQMKNGRVRGVRHNRQAGQSAALWTGIQITTSPVLATMDGDLQNDPSDFPAMLERLDDYDFVCGVRVQRSDRWIRKVSAKVARAARRRVLRVDFADTGCALRVFRRSTLDNLFPFNGLHRFLPILVHGNGARTLEVPVKHRHRVHGVSKYGVWNRLGRGIADLLAIAWYQRRRLSPVPYTESCASTTAPLPAKQKPANARTAG